MMMRCAHCFAGLRFRLKHADIMRACLFAGVRGWLVVIVTLRTKRVQIDYDCGQSNGKHDDCK